MKAEKVCLDFHGQYAESGHKPRLASRSKNKQRPSCSGLRELSYSKPTWGWGGGSVGKVLAMHGDPGSVLRTHIKKPGIVAPILHLNNG